MDRATAADPATRHERRLDAAAAAGNPLAAALAAAARAARTACPTDCHTGDPATDHDHGHGRIGTGGEAGGPHRRALRDVAAGVAAPTLIAYVLWLLDDAAARGLERIYFLARDGQVLHAIARALAPRLYPGLDCRYLAASRQIWTRAISASTDHHWLWYGDRPGTTLADVLRRLAVPGDTVADALAAHGFAPATWSQPLSDADLARLKPYLQGPDFTAAAAPARAQSRQRLVAHLAREGVLDPAPAAIVDLGWSGSLHDALSGLLAAEGARPVDCYLFGIERVKDTTWLARRHGFFFDHNRGEGADIFDRRQDQRGFLEVFCAADHGTVTGLRDGADGRTEVEVDPSWASPVAAWGLGTVRATLAAVAEGVAARLDPGTGAGAQAAALRPVVTDLLRGFWLRPTLEEARSWGAFPFNLGEGHGSFTAPLAAPYGPGDLARALRGGRALKKHEHFWVEGALAMTPAPLRGVLAGLRGARRAIRA